jgi:hypothetical protein
VLRIPGQLHMLDIAVVGDLKWNHALDRNRERDNRGAIAR